MGWRQTALPLGIAVAGVLLPPVAQHGGLRGAFLTEAGICLLTAGAVILLARDPARPVRRADEPAGNPYRQPVLWRVHGASGLLVVPQFVVAAFALEYLVTQRQYEVNRNELGLLQRVEEGFIGEVQQDLMLYPAAENLAPHLGEVIAPAGAARSAVHALTERILGQRDLELADRRGRWDQDHSTRGQHDQPPLALGTLLLLLLALLAGCTLL